MTKSKNLVATSLAGTYGHLTLNADGSYSYALDNTNPAVQALAAGATTTDTFTYAVTDDQGATSFTTLTITIHGLNDAPVAAPDVLVISAGDTLVSGDLTPGTPGQDVDVDGGTISDKLSSKEYGKIYVMLGINEVANDTEYTITQFRSLLETIREYQPDAVIYLEGNLHVTIAAQTENITNEGIDALNYKLSELADENENVYFININEVFDDETGSLTPEFTSDGIHVLGKYYETWCDWFCANTVIYGDAPEAETTTAAETTAAEEPEYTEEEQYYDNSGDTYESYDSYSDDSGYSDDGNYYDESGAYNNDSYNNEY